MNAQRGLSKLSIAAVIAILAVVMALAIPLWQQHRVRERVNAALQATDAAKLVVMEAATVHGGLASIKADELGYNPASVTDPTVASVSISDGGRITLTTRHTGASPDPILVLIPEQGKGDHGSATISWLCTVAAGDSSQVPASCGAMSAAPSPARLATSSSSHLSP